MNAPLEVTPRHLVDVVERFGLARILCVGDIMVDHFAYGEVSRISPESPVPVLKLQRNKRMLGGVGNAVRNITTLGAKAQVISVVGDDLAGEEVLSLLSHCGCVGPLIVVERSRPTTVKTRFVAQGQQLMRTDLESNTPIAAASLERLKTDFAAALDQCSAVLLSDYAKGVLTGGNAQEFIRLAQQAGKPVIVDPKGTDYQRYSGAAIVKPNLKEFRAASGFCGESDEEILVAACEFLEVCGVEHLLITRGAEGMLLVSADGGSCSLPTMAREVFDVSGAGDTVAAVLVCGLALGVPMNDASQLANFAAGLAVGKAGTATVDPAELIDCLRKRSWAEYSGKVAARNEAEGALHRWKQLGLKIGFAHGRFDLSQAASLHRLRQARTRCDRLVVGVAAEVLDAGDCQIPSEGAEAMISLLAALEFVDLVVPISGNPEALAAELCAQIVVDLDA